MSMGLPTLLVTAPTGSGSLSTKSGYSTPAVPGAPKRVLSPMRLSSPRRTSAAGLAPRAHSPARLHPSPARLHIVAADPHTRTHSPTRTASGGSSGGMSLAASKTLDPPSPTKVGLVAAPSASPTRARPPAAGRPGVITVGGKPVTIPRMPPSSEFTLVPCSPKFAPSGLICVRVDANGDGVCNASGFDTDGDGIIDALDTTGDGRIDTLVMNSASCAATAGAPRSPVAHRRPTSPCSTGVDRDVQSAPPLGSPRRSMASTSSDKNIQSAGITSQQIVLDTTHVAVTEAEALAVYRQIDADGNGQISKLELLGAARKDKKLIDFLLRRSERRGDMTEEQSFDAIDDLFESISRSKKRINKAEFTSYFCKMPEKNAASGSDASGETKRMFELIDMDSNGSVTKFEMLSAVQQNPFVAAFMLRGVNGISNLSEEEQFDAVEAIFSKISNGKKNAGFAEFATYFEKLNAAELQDRHKINRTQKRLLIIGPGFGLQLNPRQGAMLGEAGFQVRYSLNVPNPEEPGFQMPTHLPKIKAEIDQFQPDVIASASKGDLYVIALWQAGLWRGPTVMINAHPSLVRLPQDMTIVMAHGSNDETYKRTRAELQELISTGSPNRCFLYYTSNSGLVNGGYSRLGDKHNMDSLLLYDCLPRLFDAALSPAGPETQMIWSWQNRLSEQRQLAEQRLGYSPEDLRRFWVSHDGAGAGQRLHEVPRDSEEFRCVQDVYRSTPKEPAVYQNGNPAWQRATIIKVERVENALQAEGSTIPYFESLRKSIESQDVPFEPGTHTRWAFHGTDAIESIINNPLQSFQPLTSGSRLGSLWGSGTYFARDSKYVVDSNFCTARPDGTHRMLMCLVMTGIPCLGDSAHNGVLPFRQEPHRYHSSVDSLSSPEIFVVQHPSAAHPAYVITFA